ncbi:DUF2252 family protein [Amorphus sp. 3PC139-8]|uniref:DUF2252 family protein n=1 Tax=Amorphus sp. 3PC139-8 TaxID=2735676 RepID=UPI00345D03E8
MLGDDDRRFETILQEIARVDGVDLRCGPLSDKHSDMASSPFAFYRGTAGLYYRDLKDEVIDLEVAPSSKTRIQGDCHFENLGFVTEGGAWAGPAWVHFCPNDYDDAGVGHAEWDLVRYAVSLFLAADRARCDDEGTYVDWPCDRLRTSPGFAAARPAVKAFLKRYRKTCAAIVDDPVDRWDSVVDGFKGKHFLASYEKKAKKRAVHGDHFLKKSKLAKASDLKSQTPRLKHQRGRLERLLGPRAGMVDAVFRPYVDDTICDLAVRLDAGLGARDADRYYLLVGPKVDELEGEDWRSVMELYHLVEVKEQRPPAFLAHFPDLDPANRMPSAHLVIDSQRLMQRHPDRVLDEVVWNDSHWLIRTRHHAKVGVDADELADGDIADNILDHAKASGRAVALAHGRSDKRSVRFERHMCERLSKPAIGHLVDLAEAYAERVIHDWVLVRRLVRERTPSNA